MTAEQKTLLWTPSVGGAVQKMEPVTKAMANRLSAPQIAELMDAFKEIFGADQVKLVYCREGEFERGKAFESAKDSDA